MLYIEDFFLNLKGLSDASVASLTEKEYGSAWFSSTFFVDPNEIFMNGLVQLLKLSFIWNFHNEKVSRI